MAFAAYGSTIGIRTNDADALARVPELMPPAWQPIDEPMVDSLFSLRVAPPSQRAGRRNYHLLYAGAARLERTLDLERVFDTLENYLRITVAYQANSEHLFVHAGVVGWQGQAIVIPGRSFSGKTTLVSELIKAGATYYSDDMALFDAEGNVHPYPVQLAMREADGRCKYGPEDFGSQAGEKPLPVRLIVVTQYDVQARWQPRALTPARTLMALLDNTVAARKDPRTSLPILQQVALQAEAIKSKRGEAAAIVPDLLARLQDKTATR